METPSRGSASSPDPLNELGDDPATQSMLSSAAQRITRSHRSNSMYSLDFRSKMQPSRFSSPRKQTFHLDVGSGASPQKIRVTVETEDNSTSSNQENDLEEPDDNDEKVSRRLFTAATPAPSTLRRRQRSSSPSKPSSATTPARKKAKLSTTTTKVPLRGLSDDEGPADNDETATPKPKRGRPRRSGTPKPTSTNNDAQPDSPDAATLAKAPSATPKRTRKTRAATPKAEKTAGQDELASVEATPIAPSPVKRTPRATRKATPKGTTTTRSTAKSTPKSTPKKTPKRTASSAFSGSDAESVTDSRPQKRGRGRPRRQAMAPDEMAAIAEHEYEEQEEQQDIQKKTQQAQEPQENEEQDIFAGAASTSPDPIMDDLNDATSGIPFHAPTPNTIRRMRAGVSPAPTSLSSVDLISVQTPARPNEEEKNTSTDLIGEDEQPEEIEDASEDFAYGAPSADDYFSDDGFGFGNYDIPDTFDWREETAANDATSPAPVTGGDVDLQTPQLLQYAEDALVEDNDVTEAEQPVIAEEATYEQDDSEDELAPINTHSDAVENDNDAPIYSGELHAATPQVGQDVAVQTPNTESSPMIEPPTFSNDSTEYTGALAQEDVAEANTASVVVGYEQDEAMVTSSHNDYLPSRSPVSQSGHNDRPQPDDQIHFSSVESPFMHDPSASQNRHEAQIAQSEPTAANSDGEVDAVLLGSVPDNEAESDGESDMGEGATVNLRDQDTIAKGEDFSMIGMESLQTSFHMSNTALPEMGEMTSRIVSRSLESIRHGNQNNNSQDNDGLSYLDFLYESNPSTPASAAVSAAKPPRTPTATPRAAISSPTKENETVQRSLPMPKSDSPRKKAEPLGKLIARRSLHEAHATSSTPRVVTVAEEPSDVAGPEAEQQQHNREYDDSFSEIPDSVLEAAVPQTTNTPYFSRQQAELTGRIVMPEHASPDGHHEVAVEYTAGEANTHSPQPGQDVLDSPVSPAAEDDDQVAESQPEVEITSSPPIHFAPVQRAASEQATQQRSRLAREKRTTPVAFLSPRLPVTSDQNDHLRVPSEGFRPSLSPIVRAGRALQSVTSDPPTPKENEGFLRSPFRSSVARDTQSPAAAPHHDSSTPDPRPTADEEPVQDQLLREEEEVEVDLAITEQSDSHVDGDDDDVDEQSENEVADDEPTETAQSQQSPSAVTPSQRSPPSVPRAAWNMAMAPFSGFKNLVINGAQVISPRLGLSSPRSATASPASATPSTPAQVTPTPATKPTHVSPQKRTAAEAQLDGQPSSSELPAPRSAKRLRMTTPSRLTETQPGSGSDTGRSWRSYIFRENSVAGSITGFATKLISRTPINESHHETDVDADADAGMDVNVVAMPEDEAMAESRPKMTVLPSEANSTQYGSDAIMSLINDISGEGKDVEAMTDVESEGPSAQEEEDDTDMDDIPQMTPAIMPSRGQQQPDYEVSESADEDVDIWAIEADRTTRVRAAEQPDEASLPADQPTPNAVAPIRDPRLVRLVEEDPRKNARKRNISPSRLGYRNRRIDSSGDEREYSLLEEDEDEIQGPAQAKDSPRKDGRFNLDDFFSSPIALPRQLPPTSEKNIRFNEQSRQQAMEQYLEHERRREARQEADAARPMQPQQQKQKGQSATAKKPVTASTQRPKPSFVLPADTELDEPSLVDNAATASTPVSSHSPTEPVPTESPKTPSAEALKLQSKGKADRTAGESIIEDEDELERLPMNTSEVRKRFLSSLKASADFTALQEKATNAVPASPPGSSATRSPAAATAVSHPAPDDRLPAATSVSKENQPIALAAPIGPSSPIVSSPVVQMPVAPVAPKPLFTFSRPNLTRLSISRPRAERTTSLSDFLSPKKPTPRQKPAPQQQQEPLQQEEEELETLAEPAQESPGAAQESPEAAAATVDELNLQRMFAYDKAKAASRKVFFEDGPEPLPDKNTRTFIDMLVNEKQAEYERELAEEIAAVQYEEHVGFINNEDGDYDEQQDNGLQTYQLQQDQEAEESSFLTPILKPLPAKSASPTKSCIRPTTKPKTPGRVVEFTSSTMARAREEILAERGSLQDASLRFAEHFGLDTDNRVPAPVLTSRLVTVDNTNPYNEDGDVRMWDRKEVARDVAAAEQERREKRRYEVDQEVSDMMLSDTHQISLPRPYRQAPPPPRAAAEAGQPYFFPAQSIVHSRWEAPTAIEQPPRRDWALDDWLVLNEVLQAYRDEGPLNFKLHYMPRRHRASVVAPVVFDTPLHERPSHVLLNKVVHAQYDAMLVKNWHLDIVDVFALRAGHIWNGHYLMRRLFSLLIGEQRRGIFDPHE